MRCPRCGNGAGPDDRWCVTCGAALPRPGPPAEAERPPAWPDGSPGDPEWHPIAEPASWAVAACLVAAATWTAHLVADVVRLLTVAAAERSPTAAAADRVRNAATWQDALFLAGALAAAAALVAGARWLDAAYRNLPALGARRLRVAPRWARWSWLVPGLQLVRPKSLVDDTWRVSDPGLPVEPGTAWRDVPVSPLVHAWWACVIGSVVLAAVAAVIRAGEGTTPGELVAGARIEVAASAGAVAAWLLSAAVVRAVTGRQERRVAVLTGASPFVPARRVARPGPGPAPVPGRRSGRPPVTTAVRRGAPWWPSPR